MKIRKRVRLNTSFATKAISDRFPHFGATKIGDSGRHGNPHFSVFYTRLATQSGRYPLKDEDARPPAGESRSTGAHPASGQRQQHFPAEGHALEERTIRQAAVAPTAGRMPKAASETDGLPSSRGQTGSALSAPPHSRPAAKKRRTEKIVGYAEAPYVPAGGRTAHSSGHRIGGRSPAGARPPRGREASAPTAIPNTVFGATRDDRRAGFCTIRKYRHFYTPESALFRSDRGAVRHRRGRISGRGSLGKEYRYAGHCRPTAPYIGPAPTRLNVPASGGGGDFRSRPHRTGRQFRRFAPGRPSCTALAGGADTSVGERQLPQHNGRSIRLIAEHGLSTTGKRRPRPSPRANESRRSEKRALPHPTRFRSEAAHSRRRLRPPGGSGSVSNRAEKTNRSRPAPYHRRLSRSRPSTHTRPRPVTSNGKQRKQGRPTNLLPPLPENLLFGENTKTVTIEKRLSEIRQTASFRSGSGTTRK